MIQLFNGNVPGTVANYSCNAGYALIGNVSRECVNMGVEAVWTGETPTCRKQLVCMYILIRSKELDMAVECFVIWDCMYEGVHVCSQSM